MEIIKGIIGVYMGNPILNTGIIVGVLALGWFLLLQINSLNFM